MILRNLVVVDNSVAAEEQTISIDVLDVSDFDADDNDVPDEVPASPRPPTLARPTSQTGQQDGEIDSPQVALRSHRKRVTSAASQEDAVNIVCNIIACNILLLLVFYVCLSF